VSGEFYFFFLRKNTIPRSQPFFIIPNTRKGKVFTKIPVFSGLKMVYYIIVIKNTHYTKY